MDNNTNAAANNNVDAGANNSPEGANAGTGRTFTQEEVNRIVQERLAKERSKNEPSPEQIREKDLAARESAMTCKEYISENKYPVELLDLFDTADHEQFKQNVEKLKEIFPRIFIPANKVPAFIKGTNNGINSAFRGDDPIAEAFSRK